MKKLNLAVVGITGIVGLQFLRGLDERNIAVDQLYFFASKASAGKQLTFRGKTYTIEELTERSFDNKAIDFSFFTAGTPVSEKYVKIAAKHSVVIDNSTYLRMDKDTPLVVPEVNAHAIAGHQNVIACPNCSTIQAVVALKPLHDKYKLKRVVVSTYQAVSGSGKFGIVDLLTGIEATIDDASELNKQIASTTYEDDHLVDSINLDQTGYALKTYDKPIAYNVIPHIDTFEVDGYTKEETKVMNETKKIMSLPADFPITATAIRVPVINGHSESINVEFESDFELNELIELLKNAEGITYDETPTPAKYSGVDTVAVGRVRRDLSVPYGINLFVVSDNIRKGAATNAIQIIEEMTR